MKIVEFAKQKADNFQSDMKMMEAPKFPKQTPNSLKINANMLEVPKQKNKIQQMCRVT